LKAPFLVLPILQKNPAPGLRHLKRAFKAAHIGIAIGPRGTDVARAASDLVLMKADLSLTVAGVRLGRRIFDNLRKVMIYITAIHMPIADLALFPVLVGYPSVILRVHVVLTEMIIDPVFSLAFENENEEPDIMSHPPRNAADPIIGIAQVMLGRVQGGLLLIATLAVFWLTLRHGSNDGVARPAEVQRARWNGHYCGYWHRLCPSVRPVEAAATSSKFLGAAREHH
jgi:P-type Ca2+ transporter type 2C